jgi:hypothetical protein
MSKSKCLLDHVAVILLNLQAGAYTSEQSENASEIVESILNHHYERSISC